MRQKLKCLALGLLVSCSGEVAEEAVGPDAPVTGDPPAEVTDLVPGCTTLSPGPSPLRRLTRFEYNNTVAELLGDTTAPANRFPPEEESLGFDNDANVLRVPALLAEGYVAAAQDLTETLLVDPAVLGCDAAVDEATCATNFIERFGERAFRRPLLSDELTRLSGVFVTARAQFDFQNAMGAVLETILLSPQFLYRVEFGSPVAGQADVEAVDSWGLASRLSYFLWGSMPDAALFEAARAGALQTREQVRAQAERMYDDPRARKVVRHFHTYWLGISKIESQGKDPALFPDYTGRIPPLLRRQTEVFTEYQYFDGQGDLTSLLTAPTTFMNETLANYFGVTGPVGDEFVQVDLDPTRYAGLITAPSTLFWNATATRTHPILRGKFIREKLFCSPPPNPPANIVDMRDAVGDPNATERERLAVHRQDPACAACHMLTDPIGFGLENFDASGRYRELENGRPVDASGEIVGTDVSGPFNGPVELAQKVAQSQDVERCLVTEWTRFAYGRSETQQDQCNMADVAQKFRDSGGSLRELVLAMTETDAFLYRTPPSAQSSTSGSTP